ADAGNVVLGVASRDARRAPGAAREVDRHRPAPRGHAARIRGIVHAAVLPAIRRGGRTEHTLRVGRDGRAKPRQELVTRRARRCVLRLADLKPARELGCRYSLRDAAAVLARGSFRARQDFVAAHFRKTRARRSEGDVAARGGAGWKQVERAYADIT